MLTTDHKGAIAELAIAHAAASLGVGVFRPLTNGERYDLIFDLRPRLLRVQCKWVSRLGDVVIVRCRSCRRGPQGLIHRGYTAEEIDAVAGYCAEVDRCYLVLLDEFKGKSALQLRLAAARNNQQLRINWADEFDFGARLTALLGP